ncbi:MAG: protein translocase subunit SecF [Verrucomicrobia bacterium]|nr:MAG: protein translocase subunit SecF [Verrucomicrobiota bacterium]
MGTGSIKGFGVALTIGVAASLFTALVVTRLIFDFLLAKDLLKSIRMLHIIRASQLNFMALAGPAFILSWTIILVGVGYGIFGRGAKCLGVDFLGGDNVTLRFGEKVEVDKLREAITRAGIPDPLIQYQMDLGGGPQLLRITSAYDTGEKVAAVLTNGFPAAKFEKAALDKVGPTIGKEIQRTAIVASLLSLFGILVYVAFRYELSFAVGAVLAVIHDVLMTIGCYCLAGREFNAPTVAAILTIIGFSINDTIVIFDRIREDLKLGVRGTFRELINQALNQTLSRTIITSGTVFLATLALFIFGGGAINDFAFAFLVGIITGTYSSIYIASALVLWWHKGQRPATGSGVTLESTASAREPASSRA